MDLRELFGNDFEDEIGASLDWERMYASPAGQWSPDDADELGALGKTGIFGAIERLNEEARKKKQAAAKKSGILARAMAKGQAAQKAMASKSGSFVNRTVAVAQDKKKAAPKVTGSIVNRSVAALKARQEQAEKKAAAAKKAAEKKAAEKKAAEKKAADAKKAAAKKKAAEKKAQEAEKAARKKEAEDMKKKRAELQKKYDEVLAKNKVTLTPEQQVKSDQKKAALARVATQADAKIDALAQVKPVGMPEEEYVAQYGALLRAADAEKKLPSLTYDVFRECAPHGYSQLRDAGILGGCAGKRVLAMILDELDHAAAQRQATHEHVNLADTQAYRRAVLQKLNQLRMGYM